MGWRVGRNPPSVLGDIHLVGIPAPQAAFTGTYYPFHGVGWPFTLTASLLNASASSSTTGRGFFLRPHPASQPTPRGATLPPRGWSFLRPSHGDRSRPPTRQPDNNSQRAINKCCGEPLNWDRSIQRTIIARREQVFRNHRNSKTHLSKTPGQSELENWP